MVTYQLAPWAWPLCLVLALGAYQVWPRQEISWAAASLFMAGLSAWTNDVGLALVCTAVALFAALKLKSPMAWLGAVGMPVVFASLLRVRLVWFPVLPGTVSFWSGMVALTAVCIASQGLVVSGSLVGVQRALLANQSAWCFFGLVTGSQGLPIAFVGLMGMLWQQALLRVPLERVLQQRPPPVLLVVFLFLGLGGCLGLSGFSAYFQLLTPLMGQGDTVSNMQSQLFSGAGLLAVVAMLAVLVQTAAFGYFYWVRVLPRAQEQRVSMPWQQRAVPWLALGLSLVWGLYHFTVSQQAIRALQAIGLILSTSSS